LLLLLTTLVRLLSFAKFLELLIYSPTLCQIQPPICEHTIDFTSRFNVQRHFMTAKGSVVFSTAPVDDVFELRVPRIQIRNSTEEHTKVATEATEDSKYIDDDVEGEKKALRREIKQWWEGVSDHVDKLVGGLQACSEAHI
jgi:1-phosphatidylinositol-3-phosphate 5-kinase